jgi:hypothetical protein
MREGVLSPNDEENAEALKSIFHRSHSMDRRQRTTSKENVNYVTAESPKLSKIRRRLSVEGIK